MAGVLLVHAAVFHAHDQRVLVGRRPVQHITLAGGHRLRARNHRAVRGHAVETHVVVLSVIFYLDRVRRHRIDVRIPLENNRIQDGVAGIVMAVGPSIPHSHRVRTHVQVFDCDIIGGCLRCRHRPLGRCAPVQRVADRVGRTSAGNVQGDVAVHRRVVRLAAQRAVIDQFHLQFRRLLDGHRLRQVLAFRMERVDSQHCVRTGTCHQRVQGQVLRIHVRGHVQSIVRTFYPFVKIACPEAARDVGRQHRILHTEA